MAVWYKGKFPQMTQRWGSWYWHLSMTLLAIAANGDCGLAQITPDSTLGAEGSVVVPTNINGVPTQQIDGGATRGANLFHSFDEFSVTTGSAAYFNNAQNIQNIISRVTGASISNIDGLIRANGTANLFLLNPNGIVFGSNASLNIGGSFVASTATSLNFADGTQLSATANPKTPLLTISVPLGLQFGGTTGDISLQGSRLELPAKTLALVGGNVSLDGGTLSAPDGRVELGGLAASGTVGLVVDGDNLRLSYPQQVQRADVSLTNGAIVGVAAASGGSIAVNARSLNVLGGSGLVAGIAPGLGSVDSQAGDIDLDATEAISVAGSNIYNDVAREAVGNAGNINIKARSLELTDDAGLATSSFGQGNAGNVSVQVDDSVSLTNSRIYSNVLNGAVGGGGNIDIKARSLKLTDNATLTTDTYGRGNAGSVFVQASDSVSIENSKIFSGNSFANAELKVPLGNGGDINILTGSLSLSNSAQLATDSYGQGDAGSVFIRATGAVSLTSGTISSGTSIAFIGIARPLAVGKGGDINIISQSLTLDDALLSTATSGQGNAGGIFVQTTDGSVSLSDSVISSSVRPGGVGNGGNIDIQTRSLFLKEASQLRADVIGERYNLLGGIGQGGNISINATDAVDISGMDADGFSSALFTSVGFGAIGQAGNIDVKARSIRLDNGGVLLTATSSNKGGNITLQAHDLLLLRHNSLISTTAGLAQADGDGGNININAGSVVAVPIEDSNITANAYTGKGGRVDIMAKGIFGIQLRDRPTSESDITASSEFGVNGVIDIQTPNIDPRQGLVVLPSQLVDTSVLIASGCGAGRRQQQSKFIVTGTGGLPLRPGDGYISPYPTGSVRSLPSSSSSIAPAISIKGFDRERQPNGSTPAANATTSEPAPIVEATGWVFNDKGEIVLTAQPNTSTLHNPWMNPAACQHNS